MQFGNYPLPILIATVGLPRSGKTTWAKQFAEKNGYPVVCPDAIRKAIHGQDFVSLAEPFVWATAKAMVRSLFSYGYPAVILDSTNIQKKWRDEWKSSRWLTKFKVFDTSTAVCLSRVTDNDDVQLADVIRKMASEWEGLLVPLEEKLECD